MKAIAASPGAFLAKADIANAYRLLPLKPEVYNLTGFSLLGKFYFDRCLPMGASSACKTFERFSDALKSILATWYHVKNVVKVLDDFLFIGSSFEECLHALRSFEALCAGLGVPLATAMTVGPTRDLVFLGVALNSKRMVASIPGDKLASYRAAMVACLARESVSQHELKSMIGKLQFCCYIIPAGRCFLRRLHDATKGLPIPGRLVTLSEGCREDLAMWGSFWPVTTASR